MSATVTGAFKILDLASGPIKDITKAASKMDVAVESAGKALNGVGGAKVTTKLKSTQESTKDLGNEMAKTAAKTKVSGESIERTMHTCQTKTSYSIDRIIVKLRELGAQRATAKVDVDTAQATRNIAELDAQVAILKHELRTLTTAEARTELTSLGLVAAQAATAVGSSGGSGGSGGGFSLTGALGGVPWVLLAMGAAITAVLPIVVALTGAVSALVGSLGAAIGGVGVVGVGALGAMVVGLAGVAAVAIPAMGALKQVKKAQDDYNKAVDAYGKSSKQAEKAHDSLLETYSKNPGAGSVLKNASKFGQSFVKATAPGREDFFGMLNDSIKTGMSLLPTFGRIANRVMGAVRTGVDNILKPMRSREVKDILLVMGSTFSKIFSGPFSQGIASLLLFLGRLSVVASPYVVELFDTMAKWFDKLAKGAADTDHLRKVVGGLVDQAKSWLHFFGAVVNLTAAFFGSGASQGKNLIDDITKQLDKWTKWIEKHPKTMKEFFDKTVQGAKDLVGAVTSIATTLWDIGDALVPVMGGFGKLVKYANDKGLIAMFAGIGLAGYATTKVLKGAGVIGQRGNTRQRPLYVEDVKGGPGRDKTKPAPVGGPGGKGGGDKPTKLPGASGTFAEAATKAPIRTGMGILAPLLALAAASKPGVTQTPGNIVKAGIQGADPTQLLNLVGIPSLSQLLLGPVAHTGVNNQDVGSITRGIFRPPPTIIEQGKVRVNNFTGNRGPVRAGDSMMETNRAKVDAAAGRTRQQALIRATITGSPMQDLGETDQQKQKHKTFWTDIEGTTKRVLGNWRTESGKTKTGVSKDMQDIRANASRDLTAVRNNAATTASKTSASIAGITSQVRNAIKSFGGTPPPVSSGVQTNDPTVKAATFAQGGRIPGAPQGDHIPLMTRSGKLAGIVDGQEVIVNGPQERRINAKLAKMGTSLMGEIQGETRPHTTPMFAKGGRVQPGVYTASQYGGPSDTDSGIGYKGDVLANKPDTWAELSHPGSLDFAALGGLPYMTPITVSYNGKSKTLFKRDVGGGGPGLGGHARAVDIWYKSAQELGLPGLANIQVNGGGGGRGTAAAGGKAPTVRVTNIKTGGLAGTAANAGLGKVKKAADAKIRRAQPASASVGNIPGGDVSSNGGGPFGSGAGFGPMTELAKRMGLQASSGRTNHGTNTVNGNRSDHSWGGAVDYSNGSQPTPEMDRWAAFWGNPGLAGVANGPSPIKQMLYRTMIGGNHFNHVHTALEQQYAFSADKMAKVINDKLQGGAGGHGLGQGRIGSKARAMGGRLDVSEGGAMQRPIEWGGWHGRGADKVVNRPTLIGVGEAGSERFTVGPQAGGAHGANRPIVVNIEKIENNEAGDIRKIVKRELDAVAHEILHSREDGL